jgi:SAM-dependent methyltransferase
MGTHRQGARRRRSIRRLTRRTIPLPTETTAANAGLAEPVAEPVAEPKPAESGLDEFVLTAPPPAAEDGATGDESDSQPTAADGVASSLAELRLPAAGGTDEGAEAGAGASTSAPGATPELLDDEPATNPKLSFIPVSVSPARDRQVSLPPPIGSDRPKHSARGSETSPPKAAGAGARVPPPPAAPDSEPSLAVDTSALEPAANLDAAPKAATASELAESAAISSADEPPGEDVSFESSEPPRRPDSDAPTRPRIELSQEMALAAGRVTSLEISPVERSLPKPPDQVASQPSEQSSTEPLDEAPRRGSKMPPSGEPRIISSLTGRRSSIPAAVDTDEAARPAVVVTRSKIISDRPPKPSDSEPTPIVPSMRLSRRPSGGDGDEFETLDIEDVEAPLQLGGGGAVPGADSASSKAPPPPPQFKRVAMPAAPAASRRTAEQAAPIAPAPPKAAPPPPPRAAAAPLSAAVAASAPVPPPGAPVPGQPNAPLQPSAAANAPALVTGGMGMAVGSPTRKMSNRQPRRRQWWETLFSDDYLRTVVRPSAEQISRQVDFMQASLAVTKGTAVLDVGCGLGQHALEFARRGCLVVALDLALPMITRAAEDAQQENLRINFLHKDIRDIGFEGTFDAVICVGTTFGFFDDEQNREVLGRLANALKPGGRLLLEVVNRDHVLGSQPNLQWFEGDGCVVMEESDFNYYSSRITVKRTMMREDGRQTETEYSIRLYSLHELGQMMQQVGFRVKEVSGQQATRGVFFGAQSNRIILLAERRTASPARGNGHSSDSPGPNPDPES